MTALTPREEALLDRHDPDAYAGGEDNDCPHCGGDGYVFDCVDGFCADAEVGCEMCTQPCVECARLKLGRERAIRVSILRALDVEAAIAWAKSKGRWNDELDTNDVLLNMHAARAGLVELTAEEREASACWVEGLI